MDSSYFVDQTFEHINYTVTPLLAGEYEQCHFVYGVFTNADLSGIQFTDCSFSHCDLSMTNLHQTALRNVRFVHCKLVGVHFEACNPFLFEVHFQYCNLQLASFYERKMKQATFSHCVLHETDFTNADLTKAAFTECDLAGAVFDNTNIEQADFRSSFHYIINPEVNKIRKAKFSTVGLAGLLHKYQLIIE